MEVALILSLIVNLALAAVVAVLGCSVPWLWWRTFKVEEKVEQLDEVLAALNEAVGVPSAPLHQTNGQVVKRV